MSNIVISIKKTALVGRVEELKVTLNGMKNGYVPQHFYNLLFLDVIESIKVE